jgi:hypothetical protein
LNYGVRDKDKLKQVRKELYKYLESKSQYNASELSRAVQEHSWMDDETILLLVKEKNFDKAILKYISQRKFTEAEKFCSTHRSEGLLTKLLEKYFLKYTELRDQTGYESIQEAEMYRGLAIRLMQSSAAQD